MFHMRPVFSVYLSWVGFGRVTSHGAENSSLAGSGTRGTERDACHERAPTHPGRGPGHSDRAQEGESSLHGFTA